MSITYCGVAPGGEIFSYMTGSGIPKGKCLFRGEEMTIEQAEQKGIELGLRVEFRSTESFWNMLDHFYKLYGPEKIYEYAAREELDLEETLEKVKQRAG